MEKELINSRNITENPCNMCMPMGGILPFKGIEESIVMIHGSQGCSTYMRRHIAEHFNEPIDVGSSSLNEKGTIYGGEKNLKNGLDNLIKVYKPKLIGILTTCLAETIGEDIERIAAEYLEERSLENLPIVTVPTPGYGDSHTEGYFLAVKRIIESLVQKTEKHAKVNIIVPNISPADIRELKRILALMEVDYTLLPDFSETLDSPYTISYNKLPKGGTKLRDISEMSGAVATIQLGVTVEADISPGLFLEREFGVPLYNVPIPIGLENTDTFLKVLEQITGKKAPLVLEKERGRLLDAMIDSHKYNFQGRGAIFGEPELIYAITKTCLENGVHPSVVATGSKNKKVVQLLTKNFAEVSEAFSILNESDFSIIHAKCKENDVNIAIGSLEGKFLTEREGIPLVRIGFPIHDRVGGQRILSVGYWGTTLFLDRITNTILEQKLSNYRSSLQSKFYGGDDCELFGH